MHEQFPQLNAIWDEGCYVDTIDAGMLSRQRRRAQPLVGRAADHEGIEIAVVPRNPDVDGFQVLPGR